MQKTTPSGSWTEKVIVDLSLLRTLSAIQQKPQQPSFWEVIDSFISLAYAILTVLRTLLQWLVACLIFRFRIFILMVQTKKKRFIWTVAAAQAAENHGEEWVLARYLWWGIYMSLQSEQLTNSLAAAETLLKIFKAHLRLPMRTQWLRLPHGSQMITKTIPISARIVISYMMKQDILFLSFLESQSKLR